MKDGDDDDDDEDDDAAQEEAEAKEKEATCWKAAFPRSRNLPRPSRSRRAAEGSQARFTKAPQE